MKIGQFEYDNYIYNNHFKIDAIIKQLTKLGFKVYVYDPPYHSFEVHNNTESVWVQWNMHEEKWAYRRFLKSTKRRNQTRRVGVSKELNVKNIVENLKPTPPTWNICEFQSLVKIEPEKKTTRVYSTEEIYEDAELVKRVREKNKYWVVNRTDWIWYKWVYEHALSCGIKIKKFNIEKKTIKYRVLNHWNYRDMKKAYVDQWGEDEVVNYDVEKGEGKNMVKSMARYWLSNLINEYKECTEGYILNETLDEQEFKYLGNGEIFNIES